MRLVFPFDEKYLTDELYRLCDLFVPEYDPSELKIHVGKGKYSYAARALLNTNEIIMYPAYHYRYPDDYKITLLHEVGHFAYCSDPNHGPEFKKYYDTLVSRQDSIDELVIPEKYNEFLYARSVRKNRHEYVCSFCDNILFRKKRVNIKCNKCRSEMFERTIIS